MRRIVVVNKGPDRADVILRFFRETERFADQPAEALAHRGVESFTMRRAARFLPVWTVALGWQHP